LELEKDLAEKMNQLLTVNIDKLTSLQKQISLDMLLSYISQKFNKDEAFIKNNYKFYFNEFIKRFPIIFSTTHALHYCSGYNYLYDYVIIDESSQVDLISACIAFSCAKNIVLVGDKMQLPHVVKSNNIPLIKEIFKQYDLSKEFEYCSHSILDSISSSYKSNISNTFLSEHYRCDPQIIEFCNKRFYDNKLVIQTTHKDDDCGIKVITTESFHARGRTNIRQIEIIEKEILPSLENKNIGIIAPYRDQVELLQKRFNFSNCLIDTVHKFQGKEKEIIIMSTVSNKVVLFEDDEKIDFLNNPNLINVAISRAKDILYLIVSKEIIQQEGTILYDFIKYIKYFCSSGHIEHTKVFSVFDLMYSDYSPMLQSFQKRLIKISNFDSENIIGTLIKEICLSKKFGLLDYHFGYSLRKILNTSYINDEDDLKFINNPNTHCDFVVFNTLNKEIRLIIEVDGEQHKEAVQYNRDRRKDRLLTTAGLKILRLPTTSIECREKIEQALI
jgi:hypothetical protein